VSTEPTQPRGMTANELQTLMGKVIANPAMQAAVRRQGEAWREYARALPRMSPESCEALAGLATVQPPR
jgi:hypothetical protein